VKPLRVHLVRHGESLANEADKAHRPRPADWDALSERGWEQARGLGRRLEGQGIEVILASTMRRAQETAQGINEILGVPLETDPDLHELRQSDAFYGSIPEFGETASLNWMPTAPRDHAEPGAESFDAMLARGSKRARVTSGSCSSPTTAGCTSSSATRCSATRSAPSTCSGSGSPGTPTPASACSSAARGGWTGWTSQGGA
jgi:broad specificity phosphatase PhoE